MASRRLEVIIAGDASGAKKAFDDTAGEGDWLVGKMRTALGPVGGIVAGAAVAAAAGIGIALKAAYDSAVQGQKISRETERVIRTTGGAANVTADQVTGLADHLSDLTGVNHQVIQSEENLLLTFTNVKNRVGEGNDVFTQATKLALDMSTVLGSDASGAAIQLGKALNDPIKGITALSRAGVSFTQQQKDQIKEMVKAGDTLGAQKIILAELSKEFGGAAEAAATPMEKLQNRLSRFEESVGARLIPIVDAAASWLGARLPGAIDAANSALDRFGSVAAPVAATAVEHLSGALDSAGRFLGQHTDTIRTLASVGFAYLAAEVLYTATAYGAMGAAWVADQWIAAEGIVTKLAVAFQASAASGTLWTDTVITMRAAAFGLTQALTSPAAALAVFTAAIYATVTAFNEGKQQADDFIGALDKQVDKTNLQSLQAELRNVNQELTKVGQQNTSLLDMPYAFADWITFNKIFDNSLLDTTGEMQRLNDKSEELRKTTEESQAKLWELAHALAPVDQSARQGGAGIGVLSAQSQNLKKEQLSAEVNAIHGSLQSLAAAAKIDLTAPDGPQKLRELQAAVTETSPATLRLSEAFKSVASETSTAEDQLKAYKQALDSLAGVHIASQQAENAFASAIDKVKEKVGAGVNLLDAYNARNRDARAAVLGAADDSLKYSVSLFEEGRGLDAATAALNANRQRLIDTMVQTGMTRASAEAYINTLGLTPENILTTAHMNKEQAEANVNQLIGRENEAARPRSGSIYVDVGQAMANLNTLQAKLNLVGNLARSGNLGAAGYALGRTLAGANGMILRQYASGGMEAHVAQIAPAGTWRLWAEDETGGEAYIPLALSKRTRSMEILRSVAEMFGYQLAPVARNGGLAAAAQELAENIQAGGYYLDDLSWVGAYGLPGMSANYQQYRQQLVDMFTAAGGEAGFGSNPDYTASVLRGVLGSILGPDALITPHLSGLAAAAQRALAGGPLSDQLMAAFSDSGQASLTSFLTNIVSGAKELGSSASALPSPADYLTRTPNSPGDTHVHVHVSGTVVAHEEDLGRAVTRGLLAAQRAGVRMPWAN